MINSIITVLQLQANPQQ